MSGDFVLSSIENAVEIIVSQKESEAVKIAASNLKTDLEKAFGAVSRSESDRKIYIETVTDNSFKNEEYRIFAKDGNLYINGADRRGTVYGIYTISEMAGVSPWYYFADVNVHAPKELRISEDTKLSDYPTIPYRGIFINDEEELDKWSRLHMNEETIGYNTYEKVFELILRLKGNYIWPAMHVNSFNMQPESGALAERMGIVVGTSHCDMLMRSNYREWEPWIKKKGYQDAKYDYSFEGRNRDILKEYWQESAKQNKDFEVSYTLGMRGIHDSGFITDALTADSEEELMQKKCRLLEQVIRDQSEILTKTIGKPTLKTFVPYKEVLNLYDLGLDVPEDITLIWTNDNYGYVRRYPSKKEQDRAGGNGIYYHCSYWAPTVRHYLFLSSIPVAKTLYEMSKAYENGIRKLWVCNMGAIKPLEQEMEYFIRLGWDYGKENASVMDLEKYLSEWVKKNFPDIEDSLEVAKLLNKYARVSDARKVEFMEEDVFSQGPGVNEAAIRLNTLKAIYDRANEIYEALPEKEKEPFFELILMKIHAAYYTSAMYYFADRSNIMVKQNKQGLATEYTRLSKGFEDARRKMLYYYNKEMANGKWDQIVTPEDFPPPRTTMHPASVPGLVCTKTVETDEKNVPCDSFRGYVAINGKMTGCRIIKDLGHAVKSLVEIGEHGELLIEIETKKTGNLTVEVDRYPSLNSVGEIYTHISMDGGASVILKSDSNDEWRGSWVDNVTDAVDRLYVSFENVTAGKHTVKLERASKYFAVSKLVVYEDGIVENRLGAVLPYEEDFEGDELPDASYLDDVQRIWYAKNDVGERIISLGDFVCDIDVMHLTDSMSYEGKEKDLFMPNEALSVDALNSLGKEMFKENEKSIIIEAFSAHNETPYAYTKNYDFDYATGVSYRRTNLSMLIRKQGLEFEENSAPSLNYRFESEGGEYIVYVLMRIWSSKQANIPVYLDGKRVETPWKNDSPWRYEAEKLFRYVPMFKTSLSSGIHELEIKMLYSGIRIERIILKRC